MDTQNALQAFAQRVEDDNSIQAPGGLLPSVKMRPVGAQAVTVKRDPAIVLRNLKTFAAAAGEDWYYSWDVKDKNSRRPDGKTTIEGPSVKLANDLARLYGNCWGGVERVDDIGSHWVLHAIFVDFESGYEHSRPFRQRKSQGRGQGTADDRQEDIAFQIGCSKAFRNCIVNALGTFADFALAEAKNALVGRVHEKLADYRSKVIERLTSYGVLARVEKATAVASPGWDAPTVAKLIAQLQAVKEGMVTIDELYPDPDAPPPGENKPRQLETFAEGATAQPTAETSPAAGKTENGDGAKAGAKETAPVVGGVATDGKAGKSGGGRSKAADKKAPAQADAPAVAGGVAPVAASQPEQAKQADPAACPHCGREDGQHDPACPLLSTRPGPYETTGRDAVEKMATAIDGAGKAVEHDPETGEAVEELPDFLNRNKDKPAPAKVADEAELRGAAAKKHPGMSKPWLDGYVARARGAIKTDVPDYASQGLSPMSVRHWAAGWDARDMEDDFGQESEAGSDGS